MKTDLRFSPTTVISREQACAIGQRWFFDARPCSKGHIAKRGVSDGKCRKCHDEKKKRLRRRDPEFAVRKKLREARAKAAAAGATRYRGAVCASCGGDERRTSTGKCVVCGPEKRRDKDRRREAHQATFEARLKRGAPQTAASADTFVYVITAGPYTKIGVAADVAARLDSVQTGCPLPAAIHHTIGPMTRAAAMWVERAAHKFFEAKRTVREWFEVPAVEAARAIDGIRAFE